MEIDSEPKSTDNIGIGVRSARNGSLVVANVLEWKFPNLHIEELSFCLYMKAVPNTYL